MNTILILLVLSTNSFAESGIDQFLRSKIDFFQIRPMLRLEKNQNASQIELGKRLFMETELSGNRNMSCLSCHNPVHGTSDGRPLSQTQDQNGILRRNSPALFNLG